MLKRVGLQEATKVLCPAYTFSATHGGKADIKKIILRWPEISGGFPES